MKLINFLSWAYNKENKTIAIILALAAILAILAGFFAPLPAQPKGLPYDKGVYGFKLTDGFYAKRGNNIHGSWDIALPSNTPIHANMSGRVTAKYNWKAGLFIEIKDGDYEVTLCHLSEQMVLSGWEVKYGDILGYTGDSGEATGPHLHYQIRYKGQLVNPQNYI